MRLLNTKTLQLKEFFLHQVPGYVILSHTWGEEEVTFEDVKLGQAKLRKGYKKLQGTCKQALKDSYQWVWIDTCCINKSNSSELQESINSMYQWYANADQCYAYLLDIPHHKAGRSDQFAKSRWWTRGWTLRMPSCPS
jgi:hypothetical protein